MSVCVYACVCVYVCVCKSVYVRERQRERETESEHVCLVGGSLAAQQAPEFLLSQCPRTESQALVVMSPFKVGAGNLKLRPQALQ